MATFNVVDEILKGTRVPNRDLGTDDNHVLGHKFCCTVCREGPSLVDYSREVVFWATNIGARSSSSPASSRQVL